MVRLPRRRPASFALACALAMPTVAGLTFVAPLAAQQPAPAPAAGDAAAQDGQGQQQQQQQADPELKRAVEDYWHYGKIARYDLQNAAADRVLAKADNPRAVLETFRTVARDRKDNLDQWLLRWQGVKESSDNATKIIQLLGQGRGVVATDLKEIEENLKRANTNERAYRLAIDRLKVSGELAVPIVLDYLRDPGKQQYHNTARRVLVDLGRSALNPLFAATEMKGAENQDTLVAIATALGSIGYGDAAPYLARLAGDQNQPAVVRSAAEGALQRMGAGQVNASNGYYNLAEKFYYDSADVAADTRVADKPASVWYWDDAKGLQRREVPPVIFNEIMSMRAAEYALRLGAQEDALSLWLAANYKREAELPEGSTDPTRQENQPPAHYYGVSAGPQYLNSALGRAVRDRNAPVSLKVIASMQEVVGQNNLFEGNNAQALIASLEAPDRLVRFEGAFALAAALPRQAFPGSDRVVPLLAEAMAQTGSSNVLVVLGDADQRNATVEALRAAGMSVAGAGSAEEAVNASTQLPAVDVIVVSEQLGAGAVDTLLANAARNPRLAGASRVVITRTGASPYAARAATEPLLSITQATDPDGLKAAIDDARAKGQSTQLDATRATEYALRAGELLEKLAIGSGEVFNLAAAETTLLAALKDPRPEVVKAAGDVLGLLRQSQQAQAGLLDTALAEGAADDVKVSLFKSLATSAKFSGNKLNAEQTQRLEQVVSAAPNLDVRAAAAEARGALNLPAEQAKALILQQSQGTGANGNARQGEAGAARR